MQVQSRDDVVAALQHIAQFGVPGPNGARLVDVGSGPFMRYFRDEVLVDCVDGGGATLKLIEGPYGSGKTHLLQLIEDEAVGLGMAVVKTDLSDELNLYDWRLLTKFVVGSLRCRVNGVLTHSLPELLRELRRSGTYSPAALAAATYPHPGLRRAFEVMLSSSPLGAQAANLLDRFLLGDSVRVGDLQAVGIRGVKHPLNARNAEHFLRTVLGALQHVGIPGTVLLFDESERSFSPHGAAASRRMAVAANLLRRYIDAAASEQLVGCVAVFGVLPGFVQAAAAAYPALGQRVYPAHGDSCRPWRAPLVPLEAAGVQSGEPFLRGLVERFGAIADQFGAGGPDFVNRMQLAGETLLSRNAGSGVRRDLLKHMSTVLLHRLENRSAPA